MSHLPEATLKKARRIGKVLNALSAVAPKQAGRLAFRIFCTPRGGKIRERDRDFLAAAEQHTHHLDGNHLRSYVWHPLAPTAAEPPTALFLHGWESNSARWRHYVQAFVKAGWRVQALDAPAHGASGGKMLNLFIYSRAIRAFLEKTGAPDVLIGHSIGGAATVMSIAAFGAPPPKKAAIVLGVFAESTRVVRDFGNLLDLNERVLEHAALEIRRRSGQPIEAFSVREKAISLAGKLPALVLHDAQDEVAPVAEGRLVAEAWGAQFIETQGLGHRMQDKRVVQAVLEFAQK